MLAVMTSLASPVHGEAALTPSLMAFYATVATVIPVLFIALAVQGTIVQQIASLVSAVSGWFATRWQVPGGRVRRIVAYAAAVYGLVGLFAVITVAGGWGEFFSLYALYQGQDDMTGRRWILAFALALIIMVVAGPFLAFVRIGSELPQSRRKALAPAASSAEPDKKDAEQDQQPDGPQPTGLVANLVLLSVW
jgi:MFS family permease